ncbi:glycerophosphodiester phosphodiesterase [Paenibacillus ferrarius]|uniref:glycerophosphodiester phosphodiesterase n=1 Tax=Paenibacillus ferrarius TaxID=1469647 RepID=UPI003D2975DE
MSQSKPLIIGHRGAAGEAPENTLASFALAVEQGAEGIELDIHISKDGEIVVCHDPTLDRTTNGSGLICEHDWQDIRQLDAGAWFADNYRGERVPLLREVFEMLPKGFFVNVEVKYAYEGRLEQALLAYLRESGRMEDVVISSFDHQCIRRLKLAEPDVKVGLLYAANLFDHAAYARQADIDVFSLHPNYQTIAASDVKGAATAGLAIYPYTVNEEEDFARMTEAGVSGIITDYPGRLRAFLAGIQ